MSFMNKRQIVKAYNDGWLEDVKKQLVTYGKIVCVKDWETAEGFHKGAHRVYTIQHHGHEWKIHMHNGEVKQLGYKL